MAATENQNRIFTITQPERFECGTFQRKEMMNGPGFPQAATRREIIFRVAGQSRSAGRESWKNKIGALFTIDVEAGGRALVTFVPFVNFVRTAPQRLTNSWRPLAPWRAIGRWRRRFRAETQRPSKPESQRFHETFSITTDIKQPPPRTI